MFTFTILHNIEDNPGSRDRDSKDDPIHVRRGIPGPGGGRSYVREFKNLDTLVLAPIMH